MDGDMTPPDVRFRTVDEYVAEWCPKPISVPSATASGVLFRGRCLLYGYSFVNEQVGALSGVLFDGQDATGRRLAALSAAAATGECTHSCAGPVLVETGIYARIDSGGIEGALHIKPLD